MTSLHPFMYSTSLTHVFSQSSIWNTDRCTCPYPQVAPSLVSERKFKVRRHERLWVDSLKMGVHSFLRTFRKRTFNCNTGYTLRKVLREKPVKLSEGFCSASRLHIKDEFEGSQRSSKPGPYTSLLTS